MELRAYLREVWEYLALIVLAAVAAAALAFVVTGASQKVYTAEARLVVTAGLGTGASSASEVLAAPSIGQTYAVLATTRPVLLDVIARASLSYDADALLRGLRVTADPLIPFIEISVTDTNPAQAAAAANALADVLVEMASVPPANDQPGQDLLTIVERASVPDGPSGPRVLFNTILAAAATLVLGLFVVSVVAYLRDDRAIQQAANP